MYRNSFAGNNILHFFISFSLLFASCTKDDPINPNNEPDQTNLSERIILDTAYGSNAQQKMDIYLPGGRGSKTKLIVLVHGGGWMAGDKTDMNSILALVRQEWPAAAVVNINYRLASDANNIHHEQIMNDLKSAVQFMASNKTNFSISDTMFMMGASAGAHLSLLYTYAFNNNQYIKAVSDLYGPAQINDWSWYNSFNLFLGGPVSAVLTTYAGQPWNDALYQSLSPYEVVNANSKPTIIFHGTADVIVPLYHSQRLNDKLNTLGVAHEYYEYALDGHGFNAANNLDCVKKSVAFFKAHTN